MGVLHPLLMAGIGVALGYSLVNLVALVWFVVDVIAVGRLDEPVLWPDERSLTVWTGEDWFTATVMPVAFGRWGVAACREVVPRRAEAPELVARARSEHNACRRAQELVAEVLDERLGERGLLVTR